MAINPKTKQLRQQLRAACMERDDAAAFALLVKIAEIEPGDVDVIEQKKAVGQRLFDAEVADLSKLIDNGDNDQLLLAMERLGSYVEPGYAMKVAAYAEAQAIVAACKNARVEYEVNDMMAELARLDNLEAKEKKAVQIESLATNSGLLLNSAYKKVLDKVHEGRRNEIERDKQMATLEELQNNACDLEERLKLLKQTFTKAACEEILAMVSRCNTSLQELNQLSEEEKADAWQCFESIRNGTYAVRKQYVEGMRTRLLIRSLISSSALVVIGSLAYLFSTVGKRVNNIYDHMRAADIPYIQEEVRSPARHLYCLISNDYASALKHCNQFLKDQTDLLARFRQAMSKLESMKSSISSQSVQEYYVNLRAATEVYERYVKEYKAKPSGDSDMKIKEFQDALFNYFDSRRQFFLAVNHKEPFDLILRKYKDFVSEFNGMPEEGVKGIPESFWNALRRKYQDFAQLDEKALDRILDELAQANDAGIPVDNEFLSKVRHFRSGMLSVKNIRASVLNCRDLESYVRIIKENSDGYETLPRSYPLSVLKDLEDDADRIKRLAQYEVLRGLTRDANGIDLKKMSALKQIFNDGRGNAYLGALSGDMISKIKALAGEDAETKKCWPSGVLITEKDGSVYIGKTSRLGSRLFVKGIGNNPFRVEASNAKPIDLSRLRSDVGIKLKDLEDGKILPVKILQSIIRLSKKDCPAYIRLYLYDGVADLLEHYKNKEASGIAFSPTLQKDIEQLRRRNIIMSKGSWLEGFSSNKEAECESFFLSVASHDYLAEIRRNLSRVESANFVFCGYVKDDGSAQIFCGDDSNMFVYSEKKEEFVRFFTKDKNSAPFTPIFRLRDN